ncbi:hypothetical protein WJX84_005209 [Apatococcus fuscideae]|uniref:Uncharacterized protein n=1 Tax=Apatococcus fuscideae TaxID=2026836 RepID=A0AAW1T731_9CHLO
MHHFANIISPGNTLPERDFSPELVLHSEQDPASLNIEHLELEQLQIHAYSECITRMVLAEGPWLTKRREECIVTLEGACLPRCTQIELWVDGISGNLWAPKLRHLEIHAAGLIDYKMFEQCRNVETRVLSTWDIKRSREVGRVDLRGCDLACFARLKHININAMTLTERNVFSRLNAHRIEVFKLVVHDIDESQFSIEGLRGSHSA